MSKKVKKDEVHINQCDPSCQSYPGFHCIKQFYCIFLPLPGWNARPSQGYLPKMVKNNVKEGQKR